VFILQQAHIILTVYAVRHEFNTATAKQNPLATYLFSLACCNAGGLITSFLLNEGRLLDKIFSGFDLLQLSIFSLVWWLMFYAPYQAASKVVNLTGIRHSLYIMKELLRCKKIWTGVALGRTLYPGNHHVYSVILGTIASCGTGFMINLGHFVAMRPYNGKVLLSTSSLTKVSVVLATLYAVLDESDKPFIVLFQSVYLITYKLHILPSELVTSTFNLASWALTDMLDFEEVAEEKPVSVAKETQKVGPSTRTRKKKAE